MKSSWDVQRGDQGGRVHQTVLYLNTVICYSHFLQGVQKTNQISNIWHNAYLPPVFLFFIFPKSLQKALSWFEIKHFVKMKTASYTGDRFCINIASAKEQESLHSKCSVNSRYDIDRCLMKFWYKIWNLSSWWTSSFSVFLLDVLKPSIT